MSGNLAFSRQLINLRSARTVGILCAPSGMAELEDALASVQVLPSRDITLMVWMKEDSKIRKPSLPSWAGELTLRDLDFFYLPKSRKIRKFIETPFDVLIVLDMADELPLKAFSILTKARCCMGVRNNVSQGYYDFTIVPREKDSYSSLMNHLMQYSKCFPSL